jgi:hypothetical protein
MPQAEAVALISACSEPSENLWYNSVEVPPMRNLIVVGLLLALLTPAAAAQSRFNGTWKIDLGTIPLPSKPAVWLLQNGVYECNSCIPTVKVRANGQDQKVTGQPYDTISVRIVDNRTVEEIEKKNGRTVSDEEFTVSPDDNTVTDDYPRGSDPSVLPVITKVVMTRIAKGPIGSHVISGSWRALKTEKISDQLLLFTFKVSGDTLEFSRPTGQSYTAKLDGTDAVLKGDPDSNTVSVKRTNENTIVETDKHDEKVLSISWMTVVTDGKTMDIVSNDVVAGTTSHFTAQKQ